MYTFEHLMLMYKVPIALPLPVCQHLGMASPSQDAILHPLHPLLLSQLSHQAF